MFVHRLSDLLDNPTDNIAAIAKEETQREFLTLDELQALAQTPFRYEDLRRAALFSALNGLTFSDIEKLTWYEIQHSKEQGYYVRFRQKKTKGIETLPISEEVYQLLGECGEAHLIKSEAVQFLLMMPIKSYQNNLKPEKSRRNNTSNTWRTGRSAKPK